MASVQSRRQLSRARRPLFDSLEIRELLAAIRIGVLGDSLSDEYRFYAPDRTAAANWVEQLSALRADQVTFGNFTADPTSPQATETRNQGYAQNWARSGAVALLPTPPTAYDPKFQLSDELNGGYPAGSGNLGLLTQQGGLSNVDVIVILIGGNDFKNEILASLGNPLQDALGNLQKAIDRITTGVTTAVSQIRAASPTIPIVLMGTPDVGATALVGNFIRAALSPGEAAFALQVIHSAVESADEHLATIAQASNAKFIDTNDLISNFIANPTIDGIYIDPFQGGPEYTNLFVGDGFHPGTIGQSLLTNSIVAALNSIFPAEQAITPLSNQEVLTLAAQVQPDTQATISASTTEARAGQTVTFTVQIPVFPSFPTVAEATDQQGYFPTPTGVVQFFAANSSTPLGFATLRPTNIDPNTKIGQLGVATFSTAGLPAGIHAITATYSGDTVYPSQPLSTFTIYVGTKRQVQMFKILDQIRQQSGVQITPPQLDYWTRRLKRGESPRHVALAIIRRAERAQHAAGARARRAQRVGARMA